VAFKLADAYVDVELKIDKTKIRGAVTDSARAADSDAKKAGTGWGKALVGGFVGAMSIDLIRGGYDKIIGGASDLNETVAKTDVVFGSSAQQIHTWGKNAETSMGMSQQAAESNAGSLGLLFTQVGFNSKAAADMSTSWVKLAADLGSFNNADPTEILMAMSSATRGEYDALQQFVPMINAATVETKALTMTGKANAKMLNEQDKALAINALMFEQTGKAQGDFARTQDSVANQAKIAQAQLENSAASIGSFFLPKIAAVAQVITGDVIPTVREMGSVFGALPEPVKIGVGAITAVTAAAPLLNMAFEKVKGGVQGVIDKFRLMSTVGKVSSIALGAVGIALTVGVGILAHYAAKQAEAKAQVQQFSDVLREQKGVINEHTLEAARMALESSGAGEAADKLGVDFATLTKAYSGNKDALAVMRAELERLNGVEQRNQELIAAGVPGIQSKQGAIDKLNEQIGIGERAQQTYNDQVRRSKGIVDDTKTATQDHTTAEEKHAQAMAESEKKAADEAKALQELIDKLTRLGRMVTSTSEAEIDFQQAIDDATDGIKENGKNLDLNTEKGRKNRELLNGIVDSTLRRVEAEGKAGASTDRLNGLMDEGAVAFARNARAAGMTEKEIDAYTKTVFGVPASRVTKLNADKKAADKNIASLRAKLDDKGLTKERRAKITADIKKALENKAKIQREIDGLRGNVVTVRVNKEEHRYTIVHPPKVLQEKGRANGGPVYAGESYIVGDGGREELFVPATDGRILPHVPSLASSQPAAGGSGFSVGTMYVTIDASSVEQLRHVVDLMTSLEQEARRMNPRLRTVGAQ
jgi:hypothetical protein